MSSKCFICTKKKNITILILIKTANIHTLSISKEKYFLHFLHGWITLILIFVSKTKVFVLSILLHNNKQAHISITSDETYQKCHVTIYMPISCWQLTANNRNITILLAVWCNITQRIFNISSGAKKNGIFQR